MVGVVGDSPERRLARLATSMMNVWVSTRSSIPSLPSSWRVLSSSRTCLAAMMPSSHATEKMEPSAREKSSVAADGYFQRIRDIVGEGYDKLLGGIEPFRDELVLEAEITYGEGRHIEKELDELMINFEEDILKGRLAAAMADLAAAEREKNMGKSNAAGKLCHELSKKLAHVGKRRSE